MTFSEAGAPVFWIRLFGRWSTLPGQLPANANLDLCGLLFLCFLGGYTKVGRFDVKQRGWIIGLLLFWWVLPYGVAHLCWQIRDWRLEHSLHLRLAESGREDLFHFVLTRSEAQRLLHWVHSREFSYQGRMFDVVRQDERGDTLELWCYWDAEETRLKERLGAWQPSSGIPAYLSTLQLLFGQNYIIPVAAYLHGGLSGVSLAVACDLTDWHHLWPGEPPERPPNRMSQIA